MEEYEYEVEYVKGKSNKVADYLSGLLPITADSLKQAGIPEEVGNHLETEEPENQLSPSMSPERLDIYSNFTNWQQQPSAGKIKIKHNAIEKLWEEINKQDMPLENEEEWINKLSLLSFQLRVWSIYRPFKRHKIFKVFRHYLIF